MLLQGSAALVIRAGLRAVYGYLVVYAGLLVFGLMCLIWSGAAGLLGHLLSRAWGRTVGRWATSHVFCCYFWLFELTGSSLFDLRGLDALRDVEPLSIAPNR